jgi:membrane dipeptidase
MAMTDPNALHRSILAVDTHIDIPWPEGPSFFDETNRRVDLPKMRRGGLAAGCFAAYVPQGPRTEEAHAAGFARAVAMLHAINAMGRGAARVCSSVAAIEAAHRDGVTAITTATTRSGIPPIPARTLATARKSTAGCRASAGTPSPS